MAENQKTNNSSSTSHPNSNVENGKSNYRHKNSRTHTPVTGFTIEQLSAKPLPELIKSPKSTAFPVDAIVT